MLLADRWSVMKQSDRHETTFSEDERYRLLVEAVTDYAIYTLDPTGIVTSWNPGAQRFKGYKRDEIIGEHFSRFYSEQDRESGLPARALETAAREGKFENEGWRIRKDGTRFWAYVIIDPIRSESGEIVGFAKVTRDLTERKEAQEKLEKTREALFQSQKMEAIGQLTGGVAHDFNNLLMAVLGSLELLRKRLPHDPKMLALLENAVQGAERGTSLTKRMLAFARVQNLQQEAIFIPELVRGMTDLLERSLGPTVRIETRFPLNLPSIQADANQLEMVLLNLMVNARDAMPDGGEIVVSSREEKVIAGQGIGLKPGRYISLSVSDMGEGMDEETLRRAMEPFFTTKGVGNGTGLGLSMALGFAEQSGGRFVLNSQKGKGTTAELWLPVAAIPARKIDPADGPIPVPIKTQRSLVVLAVDDDALVLLNTVGMLEDLGHTVFQAFSGAEALDILRREESVDLVITDQAMPQMTGTQLAKAIRKEWPEMQVLLATGYVEMKPEVDIGLPKLSKPFFEADLVAALADIRPKRRNANRI
jgi:PAS domain S-box-containing protein